MSLKNTLVYTEWSYINIQSERIYRVTQFCILWYRCTISPHTHPRPSDPPPPSLQCSPKRGGGEGGTTTKSWTICHLTVRAHSTVGVSLHPNSFPNTSDGADQSTPDTSNRSCKFFFLFLLLFYNNVNRVCGSQCVHSGRVTVYAADILSRPGSNRPARYVCRTFDISCKLEENFQTLLQFCSFCDVSFKLTKRRQLHEKISLFLSLKNPFCSMFT